MEISRRFLGLDINDNGSKLSYSYKPFVQSSKLVGENGELVAELKRFGWFTLNFHIFDGEQKYILRRKSMEHEIHTPSGEILRTNSGCNFYLNQNALTELKFDRRFGKHVSLEIFSDVHRTALLIASCLLTVSYLHGG